MALNIAGVSVPNGGISLTKNSSGGGGFFSSFDSFLGVATKAANLATTIGQGISNYKLQRVQAGLSIEQKRAQIDALKGNAPAVAGNSSQGANGVASSIRPRQIYGNLTGVALLGVAAFLFKKYVL